MGQWLFGPTKVEADNDVSFALRLKLFFVVHWRGLFALIVPPLALFMVTPFPGQHWQWVAYCLTVMSLFWVTECIPLQITAFIPVFVFPLLNVMDNNSVTKCYMQDTSMVFLGSLILASSVEHSGLHKRLAYSAVMLVGYSHMKLLLAVCVVTTFVSMWIQNTAATVMMIPIIFALLHVFETQGVMTIYERTSSGEEVSTNLTVMYFCAAAYSSSVGGIGTLIGTGTNLVFKGLYQTDYPDAPEYLSFPLFSLFGVPTMILLEIFVYLGLAFYYLGLFRPGSAAAKRAFIPDNVKEAAKTAIKSDAKALGTLTYWECMVILLFGSAIALFFSRSPQLFRGWGDYLQAYYLKEKAVVFDSSVAMFIAALMIILPSNLSFFKHFYGKYIEDVPTRPIPSIIDWFLLNQTMPYSFMFLLGGGFALSRAATKTGLNKLIGEAMSFLKDLPNPLILFILVAAVTLVTNLGSNVAVCNVFTPIAMSTVSLKAVPDQQVPTVFCTSNMLAPPSNLPARAIGQNDLWYCIASGFTASFAFMLPVGTPPNLIIQSAAKIPTVKMIAAGFLPTVTTIIVFFLMVYFVAPLIWKLN